MGSLSDVFAHLTGPQAELLSAAATLLSAVIVAVVAPLVFHLITRRGVKDFNGAIEELKGTAESARTQAGTIRQTMGDVREVSSQVKDLGVLIASVQEALANTQNTLLESRPEQALRPANDGATPNESGRDEIRRLWRGLQEDIERQASRPDINGNTRAKYARLDRRNYFRLIEYLQDDGKLRGDFGLWREAYDKASSASHSPTEPSPTTVARMRELDRLLRDKGEEPFAVPTATPSQPRDGLGAALRTRVPRGPRTPDSEPTAPLN